METEPITCSHCGKSFSVRYAVRPKSAYCPQCKTSIVLPRVGSAHEKAHSTDASTSANTVGRPKADRSLYDIAVSRRSRRIVIGVAAVGGYLLLWGLSYLRMTILDRITSPIGWRVRTPAPFVYVATMNVEPNLQAGSTSFVWSQRGTGTHAKARGYLAYDGYGDLFSYGGDVTLSGSRREKTLIRPGLFISSIKDMNRIVPVVRARAPDFVPLDEVAKQSIVWIVVCDSSYDELDRDIWLGDDKADGIIRGMQILSEMGFDLRRLRIWRDRLSLLQKAKDGPLKQWLASLDK